VGCPRVVAGEAARIFSISIDMMEVSSLFSEPAKFKFSDNKLEKEKSELARIDRIVSNRAL